jgi:hypothetical protein
MVRIIGNPKKLKSSLSSRFFEEDSAEIERVDDH